MRIEPGLRLGPYRIDRHLGEGGMGEIYAATDTRSGTAVAVKVLPEGLADDAEARARFGREARATADLDHPNVVRLLDEGRERDVHYVVTERLSGASLDRLLARGPLTWRETLDYGIDIARGVAAIHDRGIVHRDLKPENVFVTRDGLVKILDFGIARWAAGRPDREGFETHPGDILGSVGYMSPEQATGERVGTRSDVFLLGCLLYEMLSGKRAFSEENPVETIDAILEREPAPLDDLVPETPGELTALVGRCLSKSPRARPASREVLAELESLAAEARALIDPGPGRSWWRRLVSWRPPALASRRARSLAVLPLENQGPEANRYLADGISEDLIRILATASDLEVLPWARVMRIADPGRNPQAAGRRLGVDRVLFGRLEESDRALALDVELLDVRSGGVLWSTRHRYGKHQILRLEDEVAEAIARQMEVGFDAGRRGRVRPDQTVDPEAYRLYLRGRYQWNRQSPEQLETAGARFSQALELQPDFALAWVGVADVDNVRPFWGLAAPDIAFPAARIAALRALDLAPNLAEAHTALAYVQFYYDWDWPAARASLKAAIQANPGSADAHHRLAVAQGLRLDFPAAELSFVRALQLEPTSSMILADRALILGLEGRRNEAERLCAEIAGTDPGFAPVSYYRGLVAVADGRYEDAVRWYRQASQTAGDSTTVRAAMAHTLARLGRHRSARILRDELLAERRNTYVSAYLVAIVHAGLGEDTEALEWLEQAERERCETLVWMLSDPRLRALSRSPRFGRVASALSGIETRSRGAAVGRGRGVPIE